MRGLSDSLLLDGALPGSGVVKLARGRIRGDRWVHVGDLTQPAERTFAAYLARIEAGSP